MEPALPAIRMACCHPERMTAPIRAGYLAPYGSWEERVAVLRFVQDIPTRRGHPTWPLIEQMEQSLRTFADRPKLIFWGMRDFCFNQVFLDKWLRLCPEATVHRFDDAGHYVLEDAHERIIPQIRTFLNPAGT